MTRQRIPALPPEVRLGLARDAGPEAGSFADGFREDRLAEVTRSFRAWRRDGLMIEEYSDSEAVLVSRGGDERTRSPQPALEIFRIGPGVDIHLYRPVQSPTDWVAELRDIGGPFRADFWSPGVLLNFRFSADTVEQSFQRIAAPGVRMASASDERLVIEVGQGTVLTLDPRCGNALREYTSYTRMARGSSIDYREEYDDFRLTDGQWFPFFTRRTRYLEPDASGDQQIDRQEEIVLTEVRIDSAIPDDELDPIIPAGTSILAGADLAENLALAQVLPLPATEDVRFSALPDYLARAPLAAMVREPDHVAPAPASLPSAPTQAGPAATPEPPGAPPLPPGGGGGALMLALAALLTGGIAVGWRWLRR